MDGGGSRGVGVVGAVVREELLGDLRGVGDEVDLVPEHGGLAEDGDLADDDGGDEPDHDQLRDDPLPLGLLLLALLLSCRPFFPACLPSCVRLLYVTNAATRSST